MSEELKRIIIENNFWEYKESLLCVSRHGKITYKTSFDGKSKIFGELSENGLVSLKRCKYKSEGRGVEVVGADEVADFYEISTTDKGKKMAEAIEAEEKTKQ